jgi:hypothetical protein
MDGYWTRIADKHAFGWTAVYPGIKDWLNPFKARMASSWDGSMHTVFNLMMSVCDVDCE